MRVRRRSRAPATRANDWHARLAVLPSAAFVLAVALAPAASAAQDVVLRPRVQWEVRADGIVGAASAGQLGVGVNVPAGYYIRLGAVAASGLSRLEGRTDPCARVDVEARYLLDPFGEIRWGPYAGAGFTTAWDRAERWRGYLLAVIGIEGPVRGGWRTAFEIGLGGGFRAGLVLRRARSNGR